MLNWISEEGAAEAGLHHRRRQRRAGRRRVFAAGAFLTLALALAAAGCSSPAPPSELSVVLVTLDTTRADHIGAFGGTAVPTPNLDRAAREGVVFENAVSQVPLTLPAHATIMTGRYPATHGTRHNGIYRLRGSEVTLAERLAEAGFETAAFVGAFVLNTGFGVEQGFATYDDLPFDEFNGDIDPLFSSQRTAGEVNSAVFDWLDRKPDGRFFLWVHYYDPHDPYEPPEDSGHELQGSGYDREISYVDASFGDLVERLERDDLLDHALLVVVGDHGESLGEHREKTHGVFLYSGAVHVPLFLRAPGLVPAGRRIPGPVELVDIAPTVLDLVDVAPLGGAQGESLRPWIDGARDRVDSLAFAETLFPRIEFGWSELRMVRDGRFKYIEAPTPELYDLDNDPHEEENLVSFETGTADELAAALAEWKAETTNEAAEGESTRTLTAEEEARLRALGYLGGDSIREEWRAGGERPDPKVAIRDHLPLEKARELLKSGDPGAALAEFDTILSRNPRNHVARNGKIEALVKLGRLDEAEREAMAAIAAAETDPDASVMLLNRAQRALATIYWKQGKNREAEIAYELSEEVRRSDESAAFMPGPNVATPEGAAEALRIVDRGLAKNPTDPVALSARFELALKADQPDEALATAERLAELKAGDPQTLFQAGKMLQDEQRYESAIACFEAALARTGAQAEILGHLATAQIAAGHLESAERALLQAEELQPQDPRPQFYLGNIALLRNQEQKAREHFDEALRRDPKWTEPLDNLALWLLSNGRPAEAVRVLEDALGRNPDDPKARDMLARVRRGGAPSSAP